MKNKIKKHVFGYDVFEKNIAFSQLEEGDVLLTSENEAKRNHNWSFHQERMRSVGKISKQGL